MKQRKPLSEKKSQISINFTNEQHKFLEDNPDFDIQRFCRAKMEEYINLKEVLGDYEIQATDERGERAKQQTD